MSFARGRLSFGARPQAALSQRPPFGSHLQNQQRDIYCLERRDAIAG
jgi:hypothetical protein